MEINECLFPFLIDRETHIYRLFSYKMVQSRRSPLHMAGEIHSRCAVDMHANQHILDYH